MARVRVWHVPRGEPPDEVAPVPGYCCAWVPGLPFDPGTQSRANDHLWTPRGSGSRVVKKAGPTDPGRGGSTRRQYSPCRGHDPPCQHAQHAPHAHQDHPHATWTLHARANGSGVMLCVLCVLWWPPSMAWCRACCAACCASTPPHAHAPPPPPPQAFPSLQHVSLSPAPSLCSRARQG